MSEQRPEWARRLVGFDTESTGTDDRARIVEVGAVVWEDGRLVCSVSWLLNPGDVDWTDPAVQEARGVNHISPEMIADKPTFAEAFPEIRAALAQAQVRVAHNSRFDARMLRNEFERAVRAGTLKPEDSRTQERFFTLDTLALDLHLHPNERSRSLQTIATRWNVSGWEQHRAAGDAHAAVQIAHAMVPRLPADLHVVKAVQLAAQAKWDSIIADRRARDAQKAAGK